MKTIICLIFVIIFGCFVSGCTVHFKGENLEMDMERQRVYHFDSVTFTNWAKSDIRGPVITYQIQSIDFFRSKNANILHREPKLVSR